MMDSRLPLHSAGPQLCARDDSLGPGHFLKPVQFACLILKVLLLNPGYERNAAPLLLTNYAAMDLSVKSEQG